MDDDDGDGDDITIDEPGISLHALTGIQPRSCRTVQIHVKLAGVLLTALLDTRSTHNFVNAETAQRTGISLQPRRGLQVTVANGEHVQSTGLGGDLHLQVGDEEFAIDCYAIPLEEFDLVLGVQWLETLGPLLWDFTNKTILFHCGGRKVTWEGLGCAHSRLERFPAPST